MSRCIVRPSDPRCCARSWTIPRISNRRSRCCSSFLHPEDDPSASAFHHALVQQVADPRRSPRSRAAGDRLQGAQHRPAPRRAGDDVIDLLARHLYLGKAGKKAVGYLRRAGVRTTGDVRERRGDPALRASGRGVTRRREFLRPPEDLDEHVGHYDEALELYRQVRDTTTMCVPGAVSPPCSASRGRTRSRSTS